MGIEVGRLLEVGIAVEDLASAGDDFSHLLRGPLSEVIEDDTNFLIRFKMCRVGAADLEIMESTRTEGLMARFVRRRGEGLHHIAFEVADAEAAMQVLKGCGVPVLSDRLVLMANLKAFFVDPSYFGGILVEFVQNLHPWLDGCRYEEDGEARGLDARRIVGIAARVAHPEAVARCFTDVLGARLVRPVATDSRFGAPNIECALGDIVLTLLPATPVANPATDFLPGKPGLQHVTVTVDNLADSVVRLEERGAARLTRFERGFGGYPSVFVQHPLLHGVPLELMEHR